MPSFLCRCGTVFAAVVTLVLSDPLPKCAEEPSLVVVVEEVPVSLPGDSLPNAHVLLERFAASVFHASLADNATIDTISGARAELPGGHHMRVVPAGPQRRTAKAEFLFCGANADAEGPVGAYRVAAAAKKSLDGADGAPSRWAARLTPEPNDLNLLYYWRTLNDINKKKELLTAHASNFSTIAIWLFDGEKRLMLNDVIMSDTSDEHIYHETLVHPALLATDTPRRVLVVGGGEGATVREVLRDPRVEHVTMVEIDEDLVRLCREHLDTMHNGSFFSSRLTLIYDDGVDFVRHAANASFDVVIVDGTDFSYVPASDYGNVLFSGSFYRDVRRILVDGGIFAQYVSSMDPRRELVAAGFNKTASFGVDIASFMGDGARLVFASSAMFVDEESLGDRIQRAIAEAPEREDWRYLSPESMQLGFSHQGRRMKGADHCCCNNNNYYAGGVPVAYSGSGVAPSGIGIGGFGQGSCVECPEPGESCLDNTYIYESAYWITPCYQSPNMHACDPHDASFCCCANSTVWDYTVEECVPCVEGGSCNGKAPVDQSDRWWNPCMWTTNMYSCYLPLAHSGAYDQHCCCYPGYRYDSDGGIGFWLFSQIFPFSHPCTLDPTAEDSVIQGSDSWFRCAPGTYRCSVYGSVPDNSWGAFWSDFGTDLLFMVLNLLFTCPLMCCCCCGLLFFCGVVSGRVKNDVATTQESDDSPWSEDSDEMLLNPLNVQMTEVPPAPMYAAPPAAALPASAYAMPQAAAPPASASAAPQTAALPASAYAMPQAAALPA